MKTFKLVITVALMIVTMSTSIHVNAQEFLYRSTSNFVLVNDTPQSLSLDVSYKFNMVETFAAYNINNKFFIVGGYNFNKSKGVLDERGCIVLCSNRQRDNDNYGFTMGGGGHNLFGLGGKFKSEVMAGFSKQYIDYETYRGDSSRERYEHSYNKYFAQLSFNRVTNRTSLGLSTQVSLLTADKLSSTEREGVITFNSVFFVTPAVDFKFKMFPETNLYLTAQTGISIGLNNLLADSDDPNANGYNYQTYLFDIIARIGLRYQFDFGQE